MCLSDVICLTFCDISDSVLNATRLHRSSTHHTLYGFVWMQLCGSGILTYNCVMSAGLSDRLHLKVRAKAKGDRQIVKWGDCAFALRFCEQETICSQTSTTINRSESDIRVWLPAGCLIPMATAAHVSGSTLFNKENSLSVLWN